MNISRFFALVLLPTGLAFATEPRMNAGELAHALDRVRTTARVLYVAAHPDDENTALLAYLANARHVTVAYLSMTRGGGGQNLIGDEKGALLDVIRTEELLAARRLDKATQRFSRMRDFGYSKTARETLALWGHDEALADVVRVVRAFQPDVIITRFDEEPPNHGHHTASAILAREAFAQAADPARFPEQIAEGLGPWQAKRLVHNLATWRPVAIPPDALALDVGGHDARLGIGYAELAALSRSEHKSQGFGRAGTRGQVLEHFVHVAGERATTDLLDGVALGMERLGAPAAPLVQALDRARDSLGRDTPEHALGALFDARRALDALGNAPRVVDARTRLDALIAQAAGLFVRATTPTALVTPGAAVEIELEVVPGRVATTTVRQAQAGSSPSVRLERTLSRNERATFQLKTTLSDSAPISAPYWLERAGTDGRFDVRDSSLVGAPRGPAALSVTVALDLDGRPYDVTVPVVHAWTDRVHGERVRPLLVVPPAMVTPVRDAVMLPNGKPAALELRIKAGRDRLQGVVAPGLPKGWRAEPASHAISIPTAGEERTVRFLVTPPKNASSVNVRPVFTPKNGPGGFQTWRADVVDYPHIPYSLVLQPSTVRLVPLSIHVPKGLVGYVPGSGDSVAEDLAHVGVSVETIAPDVLAAGDLSKYEAIVVGVRAYNTRQDLRNAHARLMRYVEAGGVVVVQYNTSSSWDPLNHPIGPFPLEIGSGRVTDETARIVALDPANALLRTPNALGDADFDGWVQERGLYFGQTWDARYEPVFSTHDPDEEPLVGSVLAARHGAGRYVYTGLSFFRQLPAGVPGAYRLLVNLLAPR